MGNLRFNFRSEALSKYVNVSIVIPTIRYSYYDMTKESRHHVMAGTPVKPQFQPDMHFKTVYLIHGGGDDDTVPYRYTNAELYAEMNNVMLVTPDIANSFGANTEYGIEYETFLAEELPTVVQALFPSSPCREDNYIVGFAMGGNVALSTAIRHPERYSICVDMSGGIGYTLDTQQLVHEMKSEHFVTQFPLCVNTFGPADSIPLSRHDLYHVTKKQLESGVQLPKFYLTAGSEEGEIGRRLGEDARLLKDLGCDVTYLVHKGYKHDYDYWDMMIRQLLSNTLPLDR